VANASHAGAEESELRRNYYAAARNARAGYDRGMKEPE
jgi:hypothetical protein